MLVCAKSETNTEIQFNTEKFNITQIIIFVTLTVCRLLSVYLQRTTIKTQKNLCENSEKPNSFCINQKNFAYHLESFCVPPMVRVQQVGNP